MKLIREHINEDESDYLHFIKPSEELKQREKERLEQVADIEADIGNDFANWVDTIRDKYDYVNLNDLEGIIEHVLLMLKDIEN